MLSLYALLMYTGISLTSPNTTNKSTLTSGHEAPSRVLPSSRITMPVLPGAIIEGNGLKVDYYNGVNFEEKVFSRIESQVNYIWSNQHWAPGLDELNFSARWSGKLAVPMEGSYILVLRVDDGIRLWLGGKLIVDEWHGQSVTTYKREVRLKPGRYYDLKIEYFNFYGPGVMQMSWEPPEEETSQFFGLLSNRPQTLIPKKYFSHTPVSSPTKPLIAERSVVETAPVVKNLPAPIKPKTKDNRPEAKLESKTKAKPEEGSMHRSPRQATRVETPIEPKIKAQERETFENLKIGNTIVLKQVLFEQSTYLLLKDSYEELDKLVKTLHKYPNLRIEIAGHTDNMGDARLNQALSENRATVVASYLVRNGIAASRIQARGYGSSKPIADNSVEVERAKNRRVEFIVKK